MGYSRCLLPHSVFFSYIILNERITLMAILGTATLILGMYLAGKAAT